MRGVKTAVAMLILATAALSYAQDNPAKPAPLGAATSESLLAAARAKAKEEGKNVLVIFHASWCKWCKKLESFMASDQFKPRFEENFVTVYLTVMERGDHMKEENPGALDVMIWLGGTNAGLPFFGILDAEGKPIVTSIRPIEAQDKGLNTGFPATKEEIAHFVSMLKKGAPKMTVEQLQAMKAELSKKT
jgi:thiol-disulfide isomerase/thioredoxin